MKWTIHFTVQHTVALLLLTVPMNMTPISTAPTNMTLMLYMKLIVMTPTPMLQMNPMSSQNNWLKVSKPSSVCKYPFITVCYSPVMSRSPCERLDISDLHILQMDSLYQIHIQPSGPSVAAVRPAVSRLQKSRLVPDSTSPTAAYLIGAATSTWSQLLVGSSRIFFFFLFNFYFQRLWRKKEVAT